MDFGSSREDPAILHLHKWGPSQTQIKLSEFREAFISPTRKILLLHSNEDEALLLPLVTGGSDNHELESENDFNDRNLDSCSLQDFPDDMPCTSGSATNFDTDSNVEVNSSISHSYQFISDVNSLAWGLCSDTYNYHKDTLFRELLFVSGKSGVTVHAFQKQDKTRETSRTALDGEVGKGRWVEWGHKPSCWSYEIHGSGHGLLRTSEDGKGHEPPKRWLRSFLTKVETIESDGIVLTKFPKKPLFPCFAKVVSFNILNVNQPCDLHAQEDSVTSDSSDALSDMFGVQINGFYECSKVFSSTSHQLVAFVLTLMDLASESGNEIKKSRSKTLLLVARLDRSFIQWVSLVKLDECIERSPLSEWIDFKFSDNLIVCLNTSGVIALYAAITGQYVKHLDVFRACGLGPHPDGWKQDKFSRNDGMNFNQVDEAQSNLNYPHASSSRRRMFKRLIVASYSSLLAVVDEFSLIYVICLDDYMPDKYCSREKFLPTFLHSGTGMLVDWSVGGCDIGHRNVHADFSEKSVNKAFIKTRDENLCGRGDSHVPNGFSAGSKRLTNHGSFQSELKSRVIRKIFFPNFRFSDGDCICFSPFGITCLMKKNMENQNCFQLVHFSFYLDSAVRDDSYLAAKDGLFHINGREETFIGEAVGCTFQGWFYMVREFGISAYLPSVSISSNLLPVEYIGYRHFSDNTDISSLVKGNLEINTTKCCSPWKIEILDRVLLYESTDEADRLCVENGWNLKISRVRRLQMALEYLKFDEVEKSLQMLVSLDLAEEGLLRLLFAALYLIIWKGGSDSEVSAALRLLALATQFATKMLREYGLQQRERDRYMVEGVNGTGVLYLPPILPDKVRNEVDYARKLREMAHLLEIIRKLQCRLTSKFKRTSQGSIDGEGASCLISRDILQDESQFSILPSEFMPLDVANQLEHSFLASASGFNDTNNLVLLPVDSKSNLVGEELGEISAFVPQGILKKKVLSFENPEEMMARWKIDNLDLKTVVKDALLSGRLPLAVLQLHLHHSRDSITGEQPCDTFTEVRDIGRTITYELFLKGETELAVATLQRLGDDLETSLKQLLFGTLRRSLRAQIIEEMKRYDYLGSYQWEMLEKMSIIEKLYPSSSFWRTYDFRQREFDVPSISDLPTRNNKLFLLHDHLFNSHTIECGEIDGIVLGSWMNISENCSSSEDDEDNAYLGYWVSAAVWFNAWDQSAVDRMILDQPISMGIHVLWESQLEYHLCRNSWEEVSKLLDLIPASVLLASNLQVSLDGLQPASSVGWNMKSSEYESFFGSLDELDSVCVDVPDVKIFRFSSNIICSTWLKMLVEEKLAKKLIFLKEYWEGTIEIVPLMARSGFIFCRHGFTFEDDFMESSFDRNRALQALQKLLLHYCVQYNLPNLLEFYLDHHNLVLDNDSLATFQEAAGDRQWARWLLLSRIKGCEYEASLANARSIVSRNVVPGSNIRILEIDEIIRTVDDIAEGGGEMAALATLMHAYAPIQNCLNSGTVNRCINSSAQCTLENLRPALQFFPTLWRTLVAACFGQDTTNPYLVSKVKNALSDYLNWRDGIFFSTGRDTSLLQMLPCWFPKSVRRLIQLYVQGPLGCPSLSNLSTAESLLQRDIDFFANTDLHSEISAISWEATIQKHVEEELYSSSLEDMGLGLEHHLHRGRALAAFNHILTTRVQKLKSDGESDDLDHGSTNTQADVQTLLSSLTQSEESLVLSVLPLAIMHFEDSMLVASIAFLFELCGLSARMLRVDIAALRRISSLYKSSELNENLRHRSLMGSAIHTVSHGGDVTESLARALADEYMHKDFAGVTTTTGTPKSSGKQPSQALMLVLHHLERASLPPMVDGTTCGCWLLSGNGDGAELRSRQKAASQHWSLVTMFCRMHQLALSTKYLAFLAKDNDWVGFLSEAQLGGYPFDAAVQVASKEFSDPRLKLHILTVLKGMQSRKKSGSLSYSDTVEKRSNRSLSDENLCIPIELFKILAECEKQKNPGEALLIKAKDLSWSVLAMIASCFSDVSPLTCLTIWLEITAARETSSIKVNDIASQIAENVRVAVEATNSLAASDRVLTIHYSRQSPKRRRLMDLISEGSLTASVADISRFSPGAKVFISQGIASKEERKMEFSEPDVLNNDEVLVSLSNMVAVLCEQQLFLPLLRAFEMFLPSCSLLPFIRALQAFSQMRLSEAAAHLGSFSARIKEEQSLLQANMGKEGQIGASCISSIAVKASNAMLSTCPSPYEKRCLLQLLAATDFGDGGSAATYFRRLYWKINLAEPLLRKDDGLNLGDETLDDASLLSALENGRHWEQARNWARQLEASGGPWKSAVHRVTETQAESMVAEWKEFLWDVPEERVALWGHCQALFIRYSFPALQAGLFLLKHAEAVEKDLPATELHELLLLSMQWLSGMITLSNPVYPLHLLRELETRVWLLAVESETQGKGEDFNLTSSGRDHVTKNGSSNIDRTASIITKMDNHINAMRHRTIERYDARESNQIHNKNQAIDVALSTALGGSTKTKRKAKGYVPYRRSLVEYPDKSGDNDDSSGPPNLRNEMQLQEENLKVEMSFSRWEERVSAAELERAVLSLLEFGQIAAAKQLQYKLSPGHTPSEFRLVDAALKLAAIATPSSKVSMSMLDEEVRAVILSHNILTDQGHVDPLKVLKSLSAIFTEGHGRGFCKRTVAIVKAANILGLSFSEAFEKQPIELLQLLSLKAQESFEEAHLLVQTHSMPAASVAQILAESFLKGLLAAHRGGYMDSQKEEGPAPLLWRFSDFLKWVELCPSEPEIGHALMRLVITGQEIPHACEVELLILSHHFYKSSTCLDGVDVLVALAATRVEAYVSEGAFPCLARLITGVGNFHALNFILGILVENGQLDLLLQKFSAAADANTGTAETVFRMAVLTSLKHFNPNDLDAFAMVYNHFDIKHETAALLESRAEQSCEQWFCRYDKDQNEDLLDSMCYFIEAAEVHSSIDAGNKTRKACAQASLLSLQIRMPDFQWLYLSETNARRALVEQSRFQEALIVAEAYGLNQPSEWALVLWNQMLKPDVMEEFVAEFVAVLPLQPSMLIDLAKFYRAEVAARGDQSQFSVWLTGGGLPAEWAKYLGRSFRCLLKRTRDIRLQLQLATVATGFEDMIDVCVKALDRVPDSAGPPVLRKGHGGAYLPLM